MCKQMLLLSSASAAAKGDANGVFMLLVFVVGLAIGFIVGFVVSRRIYTTQKAAPDTPAAENKPPKGQDQDEVTVNPYSAYGINARDDMTVNPYAAYTNAMDEDKTVNPYFANDMSDADDKTVNPYAAMGGFQYEAAAGDEELTSDPYHRQQVVLPQSVPQFSLDEEETINPYSIHWYAEEQSRKSSNTDEN